MRLPRAFVLCAVLVVCLSGCGGVQGGVRVEGPAATSIPWSGPVYVADSYGRAWQHPETISLAELVLLEGMKWRGWGSTRARGTGEVPCQAACSGDEPGSYRVEVTFSDRVRRGSVSYYSEVAIKPVDPPAPGWATGIDKMGTLDVPDS
ncbi:hypothetical protein [Streptomyces sp. NPDC047043]|uniref:hypothetical protein n=1 Tax=Streptomyces sp. NPDC047043 TaxID=3154497 RepID=UPI0033F7E6F0